MNRRSFLKLIPACAVVPAVLPRDETDYMFSQIINEPWVLIE